MKNKLMWKLMLVAALVLVAWIPLGALYSVVAEREGYRDRAIEEISASYASRQLVQGPILVFPYIKTRKVTTVERDGRGSLTERSSWEREEKELLVFPKRLGVDGALLPGIIHRSIYDLLIYEFGGSWEAEFEIAPVALPKGGESYEWRAPYLSFCVDDPRVIRGTPSATFDGRSISFKQGSRLTRVGPGIHAPMEQLPPPTKEARYSFTMKLELAGSGTLSFAPVGDTNTVRLASRWPHPSFQGTFLPAEREVGEEGFSARWEITSLNSTWQQQLEGDQFGLKLVSPVDTYTMVERGMKYGILFLLITFSAFFLFEAVSRSRIHAVQYLFVGFAIAVFFLLLLALSEQMAFGLAYLIAAGACALLIATYLCAALGVKRGLGFGGMLSLLYGALYLLLGSEEMALLLGAVLIFALLAAAMLLTRKIDWYREGTSGPGEKLANEPALSTSVVG